MQKDTYMCFCMVIHTVTAQREDQRRNGLTTFVKIVSIWTSHCTRPPVLLRTGRYGGTLFSIWAANTRCHRHRRNGNKSSKSRHNRSFEKGERAFICHTNIKVTHNYQRACSCQTGCIRQRLCCHHNKVFTR